MGQGQGKIVICMQKAGHQLPIGNGRQQCKWAWPNLVQYRGSNESNSAEVGQAWFNAIQ